MILLTERLIECPKKFENCLFTFNNKENHTYEDRLERVGLSKGKYRKALYPIMINIKNNKNKSGTYGFVFNEFTVIGYWDNMKNKFKTITFLKRHWRNNMKDLKVKYKKRIIKFHK